MSGWSVGVPFTLNHSPLHLGGSSNSVTTWCFFPCSCMTLLVCVMKSWFICPEGQITRKPAVIDAWLTYLHWQHTAWFIYTSYQLQCCWVLENVLGLLLACIVLIHAYFYLIQFLFIRHADRISNSSPIQISLRLQSARPPSLPLRYNVYKFLDCCMVILYVVFVMFLMGL